MLEKNHLINALNIFTLKKKKRKEKIILLIISNEEKEGWHYLVVKILSTLLREIT